MDRIEIVLFEYNWNLCFLFRASFSPLNKMLELITVVQFKCDFLIFFLLFLLSVKSLIPTINFTKQCAFRSRSLLRSHSMVIRYYSCSFRQV